MPKRNIDLTDHDNELIGALLKTGRFKDASEAVRAGLHLLGRAEKIFDDKLKLLRQEAAIGKEAYERGEYTVLDDDQALDDFFAGIEAEAAAS